MDNLVSGLLGALIGSFLGFAGAFAIQWSQNRREDKAAARTTHMEVASHATALYAIRGERAPSQLSNSAWTTSRGRLAHLLGPVEFVIVARYYANIEMIQVQEWIESVGGAPTRVRAAKALYDRCDEVLGILELRGWSGGDRRKIADEVRGANRGE
jgi:hypothetical protein